MECCLLWPLPALVNKNMNTYFTDFKSLTVKLIIHYSGLQEMLEGNFFNKRQV